MKHKAIFTPAINPKLRHAIEKVLEEFGYDVHGGGTYVKGLAWSDITFTGNHPLDLNKPDGCMDKWFEDGTGGDVVAALTHETLEHCACIECPEDCHRSRMPTNAEVEASIQADVVQHREEKNGC